MSLSFKRSYSGFSPKDFGPALWLSDTGTDPGVWEDLSGNGYNATESVVLNKPEIVINRLNGRQVRRFNGTSSRLFGPTFNGTRESLSIFIVYVPIFSQSNGWGRVFTQIGSSGLSDYASGNLIPLVRYSGSIQGGIQIDNDIRFRLDSPDNKPEIFGMVHNGTSLYRTQNGVATSPYTASLGPTFYQYALGFGIGDGSKFKGDIAEVIVYPRALTQFERQVVEGYLSEKWGIRVSSSLAPSIRVGQSFDPDASSYFSRIAAVGSSITRENMIAIDQFIRGCKEDGIWGAIKASCLLCGANTLAGALVPLVGSYPIAYNFTETNYSRTLGLKGTGLPDKYIDSMRDNSADPQNSQHLAVYRSQAGVLTGFRYYIAMGGGTAGSSALYRDGTMLITRSRSSAQFNEPGIVTTTGFIGISRSNSTGFNRRINGSTTFFTTASQTPLAGNLFVFKRNPDQGHNDDGLSFYSIGENIDLEKLEIRLNTLMSSLT